MSDERIKALLDELHRELGKSSEIDSETLAMVRNLDEEIQRLINPDLPDDGESIPEIAAELEARFASDYPVAEGVIRTLIDTLGRMGI